MDGSNQQSQEPLEDQLRRMMLSNGSAASNHNDANQRIQPTVRLPPRGSYPGTEQAQATPFMQSNNPHQAGQNHLTSRSNINQGPPTRTQGYPPQTRDNRPHNIHNQYGNQHSHRPAHHGFNQMPPQFNNAAPSHQQRGRFQQQMSLDPNAFQRRGFGQPQWQQNLGPQQLFNPHVPRGSPQYPQADYHNGQAQYLDQLATSEIRKVEMPQTERDEKEAFCLKLQEICHEVCDANPDRLPKISLEPFGSFQSGFATEGSDMDLVIVVKDHSSTSACFSLLEDDLPRALEKRLLQLGYGARLLTRTRVPIIKICEKPGGSLLDKLREEREKWDFLPNELKYPHLHPEGVDANGEGINQEESTATAPDGSLDGVTPVNESASQNHTNGQATEGQAKAKQKKKSAKDSDTNGKSETTYATAVNGTDQPQEGEGPNASLPAQKRDDKPWTRERKAGPLDFPKSGVGIQSDINFFNPLGMHNTQLLRCYSLCDSRVRPMVLFVKSWAKCRKINSSYSGTLSSYGYVLMVLHFLTNVARPPVIPNLQFHKPLGNGHPATATMDRVDEWDVCFWRNEHEIIDAAQRGLLTANREPIGSLLAHFFQYYSSLGGGHQFRWMQEVLSLRSMGGILTKEEKGWVKAVTEEGDGKKIQHRYLFCIEDPFELNHNVARTVTHNGIVAIRDEFRRARRILLDIGHGFAPKDGELFEQLIEAEDGEKSINAIDGPVARVDGVDATKAKNTSTTQVNGSAHAGNTPRQLHSLRPDQQTPRPQQARAQQPPRAKPLNFNDNDAFPALGGIAGQKKKRSSHRQPITSEEFSEVSGDKAKAILAEVKRKTDEEHAENTATGAAEAVLGDD